jgi:hypothetical protein
VPSSRVGSIINEEFGRLGLGKIISVDPYNVERKKLNRIANATAKDAVDETPKSTSAAGPCWRWGSEPRRSPSPRIWFLERR